MLVPCLHSSLHHYARVGSKDTEQVWPSNLTEDVAPISFFSFHIGEQESSTTECGTDTYAVSQFIACILQRQHCKADDITASQQDSSKCGRQVQPSLAGSRRTHNTYSLWPDQMTKH